MKVEYINSKIEGYRNVKESLTPGREYVVLSIEIQSYESSMATFEGETIFFRIENDDKQVLLYPTKLFRVTSKKLSSYWGVQLRKDGSLDLMPEEWTGAFLEEFYDDVPSAIETFKKLKLAMYAEEGINKDC